MSDSNSASSAVGTGLEGALAILFIGLKLTGYISWSWWWVLSPLWVPSLLVVVGLLLMIVVGWIKDAETRRQNKWYGRK